jgi:hypothetical protein
MGDVQLKPDATHGGWFVAQHVLEAISLLERFSERLLVMKPRQLLRPGDESKSVRRIREPFNQQVQMVWHEAVRKNCKLLLDRGALNLRQRQFDGCGILEEALFQMTAECQGISIQTRIVERPQMARSMSGHGCRKIKD